MSKSNTSLSDCKDRIYWLYKTRKDSINYRPFIGAIHFLIRLSCFDTFPHAINIQSDNNALFEFSSAAEFESSEDWYESIEFQSSFPDVIEATQIRIHNKSTIEMDSFVFKDDLSRSDHTKRIEDLSKRFKKYYN